MTRQTQAQWHAIVEQHTQSGLSPRAFCEQHNIHLQTFYSRRHALGLAKPIKRNNKIPVTQQAEHFVQAKIEKPNCTVVMQTRDAQLSVSSACDPIWLAKLLKGLAA